MARQPLSVVIYARQERGEAAAVVQKQADRLLGFAHPRGIRVYGKGVFSDEPLNELHMTVGGVVGVLDSARAEHPWQAVLVTQRRRLRRLHPLDCDPFAELEAMDRAVVAMNDHPGEAVDRLAATMPEELPPWLALTAEEKETRRQGGGAESVLDGYHMGRLPYGYTSQEHYGRQIITPVPEEAEIVRLIFSEYLRLKSMALLQRLLDRRRIRTRLGNRWGRQQIRILMANSTYIGRVRWRDVEQQGLHEAIVRPSQWYEAQEIMARNDRRRKRKREEIRWAEKKRDAQAVEALVRGP